MLAAVGYGYGYNQPYGHPQAYGGYPPPPPPPYGQQPYGQHPHGQMMFQQGMVYDFNAGPGVPETAPVPCEPTAPVFEEPKPPVQTNESVSMPGAPTMVTQAQHVPPAVPQ